MGLLLKGGRLLNLETGSLESLDVLVEGSTISRIANSIEADGHEVVGLDGLTILPGFIDMHVHLRQPGFEGKETIATGTRAAARGGYTKVACMPNTRPVLDTPEQMKYVYEVTAREGSCTVLPYGAITKGELGEELTDIAGLRSAGAVAITDDGVGVQSSSLMREAMRIAASLDVPVVIHSEDEDLAKDGCMNEGVVSQRLGLPGIPGLAESAMIARDILLAQETGAHLHVCHISDAWSVELVRWAKSMGLRVTTEVTPHHLLLTESIIDATDGEDANMKVNPPLRAERDRLACLNGLLDGTIDMIATDHAPHTPEEKQRPFRTAPFGFVGLEFAFSVLYTELVEKSGSLPLHELVKKFATNPAEVFNLSGGRVVEGGIADITVVDLEAERVVAPDEFYSKGRNTPFAGQKAKGWTVLTVNEGRITYQA
ncbi:dihydroorotase [Tumebacillus permanentifrigoris]|uniref:Dihydroorotase n=1 Tax=Tumebacillus permanentifrigoris TaxID=378543 RepID=A0A316D804_9BACL|nr:dihydroorotase [Tumebacillus permanentifrigoris]PWK12863.1 dihydroorotase [Tumebacillus permanentifrigoris]